MIRRLTVPEPRQGVHLARFIVLVPPLAFIVAVVIYMLALGRHLSVGLAPLVAQAISQSVNREVRLTRLDPFSFPTRIVVEGLRVSNHATFAGDLGHPMIDAKYVTINYSLPALLSDPKNANTAVRDITIEQAYGFVERLPNNKFNFSDLIPKKPLREVKPYLGTIFLKQATLYFRDETAIPALRSRIHAFSNVNAAIDLTSPHFVSFRATSESTERLFTLAKIDGNLFRNMASDKLGPNDIGLRIHLNISQASMPFVMNDFVPEAHPFVSFTGGRLDADVTISQLGLPKSRPMDVQGTAHLANCSFIEVKHQALLRPAYGVAGDVFFTDKQATLLMVGTTNGIPVRLSGALFGFPKTQLALRADLPQLPIERLPSTMPFIPPLPPEVRFPTPAALTASVTGDATDISASASLATPLVAVSGYNVHNVRTDITYSRGLVAIKTLTADQEGGAGVLSSQGLVDTRQSPPALVFKGSVSHIALNAFKLPANVAKQIGSLAGDANLSFVASSGKPGPPGPPVIPKPGRAKVALGPIRAQASLNIVGAVVHGYSVPVISGRVQYVQGEGVRISEVFAKDAEGGIVLVRGEVPILGNTPPRFDLALNASSIQIGPAMEAFGIPDAHGTGYFRGKLTGSVADPDLFGKLSLVAAGYKKNAIDLATGHVRYHDDTVGLEDFTVQVEPALARFSGTVGKVSTKNPSFDLQVELNRAQISDLISFVPPEVLAKANDPNLNRVLKSATGIVNTKVKLEGTANAPELRGDLTIANATIEAYHISGVQGTFEFADNVLNVPHISLAYEEARLTAGGSFNVAKKTVKASFAVNNIDAARIGIIVGSGLPISGKLAVAGFVRGEAADPEVWAQIATDDVHVGTFAFNSLRAAAHLDHGVVSSTGLPTIVKLDEATYNVASFRFDTKTKAISLNATVSGGKLATLILRIEASRWLMNKLPSNAVTALYQLPSPLDATIDVPKFVVSGTIEKPEASVVVDATKVVIGTHHLDAIHADLGYAGTVLDIREITARGATAYMNASGTIDLDGPINAQLEASNIGLGLLNPYLPQGTKLGGMLGDLTIVAKGRTKSPELTASVTLDSPSFNSVAFDRLDSGRISVANRQLTIDGLTITKDEKLKDGTTVQHIVSIRGSLPFDWSSESGTPMPVFPTNVPMDLHASIPEQSLSVISLFAPKLQGSSFSGVFHASVDIGGTLADKKLSGEIGISKGQIKPDGFKSGLQNIEALVQFSGSKATIINCRAESNQKNGGDIIATGSVLFGGGRAPVTSGIADALLGGVDLNLGIVATKFKINESKLVQFGNAGFGGEINGALKVTEGLLSPLVAGTLTIKNAGVIMPTTQTIAKGIAPAPVINPRFSMNVMVPRGAHVESSQVKVSDASGALTVLGSLDVPNVRGQLVINKGTFNLPTARFRIVSGGTVDVMYHPESPADDTGLNVTVNLEARTSLSISQRTLASNQGSLNTGIAVTPSLLGSYGGGDRYQITALIYGTLKSDGTGLILKFSSEPNLAESQILGALGGQFVRDISAGAVDTGLKSLFAQVLSNQLGGVFLDSLYDYTGLDVSIDYNPGLPLVLSVTKQLTPKLEVTFTRLDSSRAGGAVATSLSPPQYQLRLGYNLSKALRFSLSTDDQHSFGAALEGVFRF